MEVKQTCSSVVYVHHLFFAGKSPKNNERSTKRKMRERMVASLGMKSRWATTYCSRLTVAKCRRLFVVSVRVQFVDWATVVCHTSCLQTSRPNSVVPRTKNRYIADFTHHTYNTPIKISPCLLKLQLAKVGAFFETHCSVLRPNFMWQFTGHHLEPVL